MGGKVEIDGIVLSVGGDNAIDIKTNWVVNAAGLYAQKVAAGIAGLAPQFVPPTYYAKGNYYALVGKPPFTRPILSGFLKKGRSGGPCDGRSWGQVRFGPDVEWIDHIDYDVDPKRADKFYDAVRKYYPALADGAIQPAYSGIRPKLQAPDEAAKDFVLQGSAGKHGIEGAGKICLGLNHRG